MLPTKGYFQDIECPYYNNSCNRPYCHFRHKKKNQENDDNIRQNSENNQVPTYKPTPKSELANIKNHIPISYVPDLVYRSNTNRTTAITTTKIPSTTITTSKINLPTYKPTPLSILSSVNNQKQTNSDNSNENDNNKRNSDEIETIKQNIANVEYNPESSLQNDINFEDLSAEFELIDDIIVDTKSKSSKENFNNNEKNEENIKRDKDTSSSRSSSHRKSSRHKPSKSSHKNDKVKKSSHRSDDSKLEHKKSTSSSNSKKSTTTTSSSSHKHSKHKHHDSKRHKSKEKDDKKKRSVKSNRNGDKVTTKDSSSKTIHKKCRKDDDNILELDNNFIPHDDDDEEEDDDDEDNTFLECYKIFQEYKPELNETKNDNDKLEIIKENDEEIEESLIKPKKRIAHHSNQQEQIKSNNSIDHVNNKVKHQPTPAHVMTNRFKLAKLQQEQEKLDNDLIGIKRQLNDDTIKNHKIQKINTNKVIRRIAPVQNVNSIQLAKAKIIEEINKRKLSNNEHNNRTLAQTFKGAKRVAHVPDDKSLSDIPDVINIEKSKLPVNVRTRYLTLIANECIKLYLNKNDSYKRALNEEFICYEKCKVLLTYRNSAMLTINRLRKEIQEREKSGLDLINNYDENDKNKNKNQLKLKRDELYNKLKNYLLNDDELNLHGYPRESLIPGHAIIFNNNNTNNNINLDSNKRKCARCSKTYLVDKNGLVLYDEECMYHPLKKRTIRGEQKYLCCKSNDDIGCMTSNTHVSESNNNELEGYQITMNSNNEKNDTRNYSIYALDCEMCYTTKGLELTRITIVDVDCKTVYDTLVKPLNPIIDYNTTFSGITKEQMDKTSTNILQVQANILHLCNSNTILIGHSLESDMKALKIIHNNIIDTSVLFPHKMGLPHKRALRVLASEFLKKIIQNNVSGHDSAEDAIACMELVLWKLKEDMKVKGIK